MSKDRSPRMKKLGEFLRQERDVLIGYVRRRIDDTVDQDAEDIVQDVIVNLFDRADPTLPIRNLAAFVYRALRNKIIDRYRKRRETAPLMEDVLKSGEDPALEFERQEMMDRIFDCMDGLDPAEKAVIMATEFEGRSFKELSEEWKVPLGTLLARKSRALGKIRNHLTGQLNRK